MNKNNMDKKLTNNIEHIKMALGNAGDLVVRKSSIGLLDNKFALIYIKGLIDEDLVNNTILRVLQLNQKPIESNLFENIYEEMITTTEIKKVNDFDEVIKGILAGETAFLLDQVDMGIIMGTSGGAYRSIEEPQSEAVVRGSRTGFVENFKINVALIRRELKDPNLRIDMLDIGKHSNQKIAICYVDGIVNPDILDEVKRRLHTLDIDFAPDSGFVEQWIEDSSLSPFPQILDTERPDRVIFNILKGKIGIIVEGSPFALLMPVTYGDYMKSIEDYNQRWIISTFFRLLRYVGVYIAIFLPALYVALVSYHPELIPTQLLYSIASSREGVPFPSLIEALLMALVYEILQEAGIRLPKKIGQTIGIVGGIVIGEIAVMAGIVGPLMVIVISFTAIAAFTIPNYSLAIGLRTFRFASIFAAAVLGLYGIILIFIIMNIHIVNLKSMGIPYSSPFAPNYLWGLSNIFVRAPITTLAKHQTQPYLTANKETNDGGQAK